MVLSATILNALATAVASVQSGEPPILRDQLGFELRDPILRRRVWHAHPMADLRPDGKRHEIME